MGGASADKRSKNPVTGFSSSEINQLEAYAKGKLKPCPFCGSEFVSVGIKARSRRRVAYGCFCKMCTCSMTISNPDIGSRGIDRLIQAWNTRAV